MNQENINVAVVHNKIRHYRLPLFQKIADEFDADFYIFDEVKDEYPFAVDFVNRIRLFQNIRQNAYDVVIVPDYVFLESWIASIAARSSGAAVIPLTEVWDMPHTKSWKTFLKKSLAYANSIIADTYLVPGEKAKEFLLTNSLAEPPDIFKTPNAHNLPEGEQVSRSDYGLNKDQKVILYIGQLIERKGVDDLIHALDYLEIGAKEVLLIGGEGNDEYTKYLNQIADEDNVKFLGWVPDQKIRGLYEIADVYVLPSLQDPYPLTVVEAMSTGTPVIISNGVGEAGDIVRQGETGEIVPTKSPQALAEKLKKVLSDEEYRTRLSEQGREIAVNKVTYNKMMDGVRGAIERANK